MKAPQNRTHKPWKLELVFHTSNSFRAAGRFADQQGAMAAAVEHAATCKIVRITGPDGLFAYWLDGVFHDGNLRDAAVGKPVPSPRHQIDRVFRILRREYQRDRTIRGVLISLAQSCSTSKLTV
jgi:hypothetical protein